MKGFVYISLLWKINYLLAYLNVYFVEIIKFKNKYI